MPPKKKPKLGNVGKKPKKGKPPKGPENPTPEGAGPAAADPDKKDELRPGTDNLPESYGKQDVRKMPTRCSHAAEYCV